MDNCYGPSLPSSSGERQDNRHHGKADHHLARSFAEPRAFASRYAAFWHVMTPQKVRAVRLPDITSKTKANKRKPAWHLLIKS